MSQFPCRLLIIGAGPAGLCSLRHALASLYKIQAVVFEQQSDIGGIWNYTGAEVKLWDSNGNPLIFPMYTDLQCNLPKQLMEFQDYKHKAHVNPFPGQKDIHEYLLDYTNHFDLWPCIKLNSRIVNVQYCQNSTWVVAVEDTNTLARKSYVFDAIMCCVGVNFYPKIPYIEGMTKFQGNVIHSKYFKDCDQFRGKKVVCLGLGPSCADLCLKLAHVAKQVVACHRFPGGFSLGLLPPNVRETVNVKRLNEWSVTTEMDEDIPCDILILCTGYQSVFPFLDLELDIGNNSCITNTLYKKMLIPEYPSFAFINAHGMAAEFLVMEIQAKYFLSCLENKVFLPPLPILRRAAIRASRGLGKKSRGKLTESLRGETFALTEVREYLEDLAIEGGFAADFKHIPLHLTVFQWVIGRIFGSALIYRKDELKVIAPDIWEYTSATVDGKKGQGKLFQLKRDGSVEVTDVGHS